MKPLSPASMLDLSPLLKNNLAFHAILEREVKKVQYGQITVNVELKDGRVDLNSLNIVVNKRVRY